MVAEKGCNQRYCNKICKKTSRLQRDIFTNISHYSSRVIFGSNFCGSFWKRWREVPVVDDVFSSHEQLIYPTTSLDEKCIEFEFQTNQNFYVDLRQTYSALKLKFVKGLGYKNYNTNESKKSTKRKQSR